MKRILVIDDSPSVRQQVGMALTQAGFTVVEAPDGAKGLELIEGSAFSAVICDVNMPRMNGLEMLEALKARGTRPSLPVIMLTTEGQPAMIQRAKAAGAKGWMIKPFKADLLIAAVQKLAA
jgi:two-component system chemotaxis response regulator CheY